MKLVKSIVMLTLTLISFSAHANTGCDTEIALAALNIDSRVQSGNTQCKAQEPRLSDFGVGHGIVGSVEVICPELIDENVPVKSGITYDFHLAPGSCEILSIEPQPVETNVPGYPCLRPKPCGACYTNCK